MANAISVLRNPVIGRNNFSVLAAVETSLGLDANGHQSSF